MRISFFDITKSKVLNTFIIIVLTSFVFNSYAQNRESDIPEFSEMTYEELKEAFYSSFYKHEFTQADSIAKITLIKAKKEKDSVAMINSYMRLSRNNEKYFYLSQIYIDSCILFSKRLNNKELLGESYFFKGQLMKTHNQFKYALENYIKAKDIYREIGKIRTQMALQHMIGMLKLRTGDNKDALKIVEEAVKFEKNNLKYTDDNLSYIISLHDLAIVYAANGMHEMTSVINKEGYQLAEKNPEYEKLYFTHLEGANQFYKKNFKIAKDSLLKAIPFLKASKDQDLTFAYYYLGKIYENESDVEKSVLYFKKIDSIYMNTKFIMNEPRPAYESLIRYYKNNGDLENQLYYLNRLLQVDSILDNQYSGLTKTFFKEYDTPKILNQKAEIIKELDNKNNNYLMIIWIVFIVCLMLLLIVFYVTKSKRKSKKRYEEIINEIKYGRKTKNSNQDETLDLSSDIYKEISENLNEFEEKLGFLEPKLNLKQLSQKIGVHSRYVSKYINLVKNKNIQNYINDLRVDYAIERLKKDKTFRKFTVKAIAQDVGFNNTESFTKAFKKRTEITVSFFLKKLNN